ncbi:hypothetical protein KQX54_004591 [Cotesia glomerata]|uniref:Uncharacterized protein n=1 Tax=Cotesia glomerata TaxID=32391 RepID=A0AAV7IXG3_COTGL|nr:hypothetical protein KQX54_004591 [Cotesia glomerata]
MDLNTATITQSCFLQYSDLNFYRSILDSPYRHSGQHGLLMILAITHWFEPDSISLEISAPESDKWLNKQQTTIRYMHHRVILKLPLGVNLLPRIKMSNEETLADRNVEILEDQEKLIKRVSEMARGMERVWSFPGSIPP